MQVMGEGVSHPVQGSTASSPTGGYPIQPNDGRTPSSPMGREYPIQPDKGYPIQPDGGVPQERCGGTPSKDRAAQQILAT